MSHAYGYSVAGMGLWCNTPRLNVMPVKRMLQSNCAVTSHNPMCLGCLLQVWVSGAMP